MSCGLYYEHITIVDYDSSNCRSKLSSLTSVNDDTSYAKARANKKFIVKASLTIVETFL